jgi:calcium-dependent protein kinase
MGNFFKRLLKVTPKDPKDDNKEDKAVVINPAAQQAQDKKNVNMNMVFEEIMDVKGAEKGAMLLSESIGKPRETYETIENIAPVSYGLIKKVRHKISRKTRAMRIIKKELIEVKEEETLLFKELALLRSLDHPNIIKLYEFYRDEKYYYLISE